ncbi:relaxase/mobilization nuclease domain-containing protein [Eubacterium pyruvativorans]|uniref:relaxase/mobilization nuclease domain-containing protein n=1 Tax=Eubacterium pyruvativorans TaxID=155865 RepID=UPI003F8CC1EF
MATTSLWHIGGNIKDVINYVENPEKTVLKDELKQLGDVCDYVRRPGGIKEKKLITTLNCNTTCALEEMLIVKQGFRKTDGYMAWHGYQSFKPGEISEELCHEIGVKLAKEMWGDRFQVIVTTHLDKEHLHNHFCFNSVSFRDGKKYNYSKKEIARLRETSDRLCQEYGLSIIEKPHKAAVRPVWMDEKTGKPTRYNVYRADIIDAMEKSNSMQGFQNYLVRLGYDVDLSGAHWKIKLPKYEHYTRMDTLDPRFTPEVIHEFIGQTRRFIRNQSAEVTYPASMPKEWRTKSFFEILLSGTKLYKLYLYYCYQLGIYPKGTNYKPTSPYLKEDLRRCDEISQQTDYLAENNIESMEDLMKDQSEIQEKMDELIAERTKLQNKIRRASSEQKELLREEKKELTTEITTLRKKLKLNEGIEKRSVGMRDNLERLMNNEVRAQEQTKNQQRKESMER